MLLRPFNLIISYQLQKENFVIFNILEIQTFSPKKDFSRIFDIAFRFLGQTPCTLSGLKLHLGCNVWPSNDEFYIYAYYIY